jgi:hypothetical protein
MIAKWNLTGGTPDFIRTVYQNVLDRGAENQEVFDYHTRSAYDNGLATVITGFVSSPEYRSKNLYRRDCQETVPFNPGSRGWIRRIGISCSGDKRREVNV